VFTKLLGLNYKIVYKQGAENRAAYALSRKPFLDSECYAISVCQPKWLEEVTQSYEADQYCKDVIAKLAVDTNAVPNFSWNNGVLHYKNRIWIRTDQVLHQKLIEAFHCSTVGGHFGIPITYRRMKQFLAWKGMKFDVHAFVKTCTVCQQAKPDRSKSLGLLQPLPIPNTAWQMVSMDFIEGLPQSGVVNCILVVLDKFTKYTHFLPLKHPYSAQSVAKLFLDNVYKLYGLIVSDRDTIFTSTFWKELFSLTQVQLRMSITYHPQSDGQTERVNQCLETFLRCFAHACQKKWSVWLPLPEFWYNTSHHSAIG
jgi:hypothetical protein